MNSVSKAVLCLLSLALAMIACSTTSPTINAPLNTRSLELLKDPNSDGQAIFRGLLFGEQTLGELLPEVWRDGRSLFDLAPDKTERDAGLKTVNAFMQKFEATNKTFFTDLSKSMRSGDPLQVERALGRIGDTVDAMFPNELEPDLSGDTALKLFIYRNRFIYKNKAVASNRYIMPYKYIKVYTSAMLEDDTPLGRLIGADNLKTLAQETLIAGLTKRLAQ